MKQATAVIRMLLLIILILGLTVFHPVDAHTFSPLNTIQVNTEIDEYNTTGTGTGCSLREAIQSANTDTAFGGCSTGSGTDTITFQSGLDMIHLAIPGTLGSDNASGDLNITSSLTIQGPRWQDLNISAGDPVTNPSRLFNVNDLNSEVAVAVTIRGVALTNGNARAESGGAITNSENLLLDGVAMVGNHTDGNGGAIRSFFSSDFSQLTIHECLIFGNTADGAGGAIDNQTPMLIEDSSIYLNEAGGYDTFSWGGGALFSTMTPTTIRRTKFHNNSSTYNGGNLYLTASAGIYLIEDSIIEGGTTEYGDGGNIYSYAGPGNEVDVILRRTLVYDGYAGDNMDPEEKGGGIYNSANMTLENVTVSGNSAYLGGGIYSDANSWSAELKNVTITNNSHGNGSYGAGIYQEVGAVMAVYNSIVALNGGSCGGHYCDCYTTSHISSGYNIERGNSCGFENTGDQQFTDPLIGPLAENWGFSRTHMLYLGSPAIDHGNNATCLSEDQRGWYRPIEGADLDDPPVATCDVGAYESGHGLTFLPVLRK